MSFRRNSYQQVSIFDSTFGLSEREQKALDRSWAKVFAEDVFPQIDEERFSVLYSDKASRPNTLVNVIVGALIIKELFGISDDEIVDNLMLDPRYQMALHTSSCEEQPLSDKSLSRFRMRCYNYEQIHGVDLYHDCVTGLAEASARMMGMLIRRKKYEKCRQVIAVAVEEHGVPLSAFLYYHLGLAAEGMGDPAGAEKQFRRAVTIPVNLRSYMIEYSGYDDYLPCLKLCALAYDRGEKEEAEAWNSRAGSAWPEGRAWRINRERFFTPSIPSGREPLVSVIMPAYHAEAYIAEAVSSVLEQSWRNLELIIVDDASTDRTADIARSFSDPRIRLLANSRNLGIAASTNRAIAASRGEYMALMDDDDISLPDRLKAQVTFLENNRSIMIVGTGSDLIDPEGRCFGCMPAFPESPKHFQAKLLIENVEFCNSSAMIRKSFLEEKNLSYREGYLGMQDYRFYMEASKQGAISCLTDILHRYCFHSGGISVRTRRIFPSDRARIYNGIRCDSLRRSGVRLNEREKEALGRLLPEGEIPLWNRQEREQLSMIFAKIREQLAENGFAAMRELEGILWSVLNR